MRPLRSFSLFRRRVRSRGHSVDSNETQSSYDSTLACTTSIRPYELPADACVFELAAGDLPASTNAERTEVYELPADNDWPAMMRTAPPYELLAPTPGWHIREERDKLYGGYYEPETPYNAQQSTSSRPGGIPHHTRPDYTELAKRRPPALPLLAPQTVQSPPPDRSLSESVLYANIQEELKDIRARWRRFRSLQSMDNANQSQFYLSDSAWSNGSAASAIPVVASSTSILRLHSVGDFDNARVYGLRHSLPLYA